MIATKGPIWDVLAPSDQETPGDITEEFGSCSGDQWVYRCFDAAGGLIYIGVTCRGVERFRQGHRFANWGKRVARIEVEHFPAREEALARERELIEELSPPENTVHIRPPKPTIKGVTKKEAASFLAGSRLAVEMAIESGIQPIRRSGRRAYYDPDELVEFWAERIRTGAGT